MNDRRRPGSPQQPRAAMPAVAVGVAIVAAILGFFILKQFGNDSSAKKDSAAAGVDTTVDPTGSGVPASDANGNPIAPGVDATATTTPPVAPIAPLRNAYKVVVANASKKQGAAKGLTTRLEVDGFSPLPPTNVIEAVVAPPITTTRVFFALTFEAAAQDVATYLGPGIIPEPLLDPSPVGPDSSGAQIVIALGTDLAGNVPAGAQPQVTGVNTTGSNPAIAPAGGSPNETTATSAP